MAGQSSPSVRPTPRMVSAHLSCLVFGIGLLAWSFAPAVVERALTGHAPGLDALLFGSITFLVGLAFLAFHWLIRRGVCWALWAAFLSALVIATTSVAAITTAPTASSSLFSLLLAGITTICTWLAIAEARWRNQMHAG